MIRYSCCCGYFQMIRCYGGCCYSRDLPQFLLNWYVDLQSYHGDDVLRLGACQHQDDGDLHCRDDDGNHRDSNGLTFRSEYVLQDGSGRDGYSSNRDVRVNAKHDLRDMLRRMQVSRSRSSHDVDNERRYRSANSRYANTMGDRSSSQR